MTQAGGSPRRIAAPLRQEVVEGLRAAIVAAEFAPGERLYENALCERFAVSRTVVREALRQLETEGLVSMVAHRGPVVAVLTPEDARDLYELRAALEGTAGALFAERAGDDERQALEAALAEVEAAFATGDITLELAAKDRFYETLFAGSGNRAITATVRGIKARVQVLRGLSLRTEGRAAVSLQELRDIVQAAAVAADPEAARQACEAHVRNAGVLALAALEASA
ncbi:GntR family transcriptional regulator [Nocardioides fonticola]|uniref:GntR family transcriptional regulator n=1 Tax=Nocardioides fonticola TaxID=450363 RepID=A0ABP7XE37_9ACTN